MSIDAYHDALEIVSKLSLKERIDLIQEILATVKQTVVDPQKHTNPKEADSISQEADDAPLHNITELRGLGKEIWEGIDAQEYVDQERNSWA